MSFRIAAAQYPLQSHKNISAWKVYVESWVKEAVDNKAALLVFPEYGAMELVSTMPMEVQKDLQLQVQKMDELKDEFILTYSNLAKKYKCSILAPSLPIKNAEGRSINRAYYFGPGGGMSSQDKHHMTRFEDEQWQVVSGDPSLNALETPLGTFGICICFDVEFPQSAHKFAREGVKVLLAPSCTEGLAGANRVHIGARARALENQYYVVVSQTVGDAEWSEAVDKNTGYAAVYGPSDVGFPEDGIVAQGKLNEPGWLYAEIDLEKVDHVRENGQVLNYLHALKK